MSETATQTIPAAFYGERVTWVRHWTDSLFSFRCTRNPALRFIAGQFCMIGLMVEGKPLTRAYSVVSPPWDEELEFLSIKVPNGPLTSRLQHIVVGDTVLIGRKPVGTLICESLLPGRNLWMMCTGTGLAPFMSLLRDPDTYDKFDRVIVAHTVRHVNELAYRGYIADEMPSHELLGEMASEKLVYAPAVTREEFPFQGRITDRIRTGQLYADTGLEPLDPEKDRVMLCGSEVFNADMEKLLEDAGFQEGTNNKPGTYVLEKAFVTK